MSNDSDILLSENDFTDVIVNEKTFKIGKLKTITFLKLVKFIGKTISKYSKEVKTMELGKSNAQDFMEFVELFDETELVEFESIILNHNDKEFCKEIAIEELIDIISAICEHNNFDKLKKKVQRVAGKFRGVIATSS